MKSAQDRDREMLLALSAATGRSISALAGDAGVAVTTFTRLVNRKSPHRLSSTTVEKLKTKFPDFFGETDDTVDMPDYVEVEILPSYGGMGGGGFGEGEPGRALLARQLIEERLRGQPADFLMIDVRGDSMVEAGYLHGDQILVDRRDRDPTQPGPFALFDGDTYVVKLVERVPLQRGKLRIFSANDRYTEYQVAEDEAKLIGRPVWLGRAL
ncbi:S24 family peptidase [Sphingomonas koreensis]|uniref:S24 family peptidase n=1 Tax=Sphingomonas koreensis TaxID=93064 RepID=A0A430G2D6_9SPHN|nr:S24 family peptidase [Sphingomonas koreensis]RSY83132.1 S24 family peptidase [Sphingomonas koreensis]